MRVWRSYLGGLLSRLPGKPLGGGCGAGQSLGQSEEGAGKGRAGTRPYDAIPLTGKSGWFNLLQLWRNDGFHKSHLVMVKNFEQLGPIYRERIGSQESLYIFQSLDIATLFKAEGSTPRRLGIDSWLAHRELRNYALGVFLKNGNEWRTDRVALNKVVVAPSAVAGFTPLLDAAARDFVETVRRLQPGTWHLQRQLLRFSLEASCHALYGKRLGLLETENCPQAERFLQAVQDMLRTTLPGLFLPVPLLKHLNTKVWRDHVMAWDIIFQHADWCIKETLQRLQQGPEERADGGKCILSQLLARSALSLETIKANMTELTVGSVDTTAVSLHFALLELARNPRVQSALRSEVTHAYHQAQGQASVVLGHVPLLKATIKEVLRLYPVGITLQRYPVTDITLQNYHVPAGTLVQVGLYQLGRSRDLFEEPERFDPQRWLRADSSRYFRALGFGFGPRQCVGRRLAETEMELCLLHILRNFWIETNSKEEIRVVYNVITMPDSPPVLTFRPCVVTDSSSTGAV